MTIVRAFLRATRVMNTSIHLDATPLHCAVSRGHTRLVATMIEQRNCVNLRNKDGMTPAMLAAFSVFE